MGFGQQQSYCGKGLKGYQCSDDCVKEVVSDVFEDVDYVDVENIEVQVQNGEVILIGIVFDCGQKCCVEECVEYLCGVKDVYN